MNIAVATIGHNNPPMTPFEISKSAIDGLYSEAKNWLDGEPLSSQEQADEVQKLMRLIQAAEKEADARRVEENRPFDEGKAEVQARYAPLIANTKTTKGMTVRAVELCKEALKPWLLKVDEENRRKAEEARREAEEKQRVAMEAMRQRQSIEDAERAEALVREAKAAEADARRAGNATAAAKGAGRAVTLRDYYTAEVTDYTAFARHIWTAHRSDMQDFLDALAKRIVDAGAHHGIPGVTVHHDRRPV
jgi:hypothetical protein